MKTQKPIKYPEKWSWYLPKLTPLRVEKLLAGMKSYFRFFILPDHFGWDNDEKILWVRMDDAARREQLGIYVNGFYAAIK